MLPAASVESSRDRQPFYTIGHSTLAFEEFVRLLEGEGITRVVDVRTMSRSRANPQYNGDALRRSLLGFQIDYEHVPALGGLRGKNPGVPPAVNAFWRNDSFHNYADYAMGDAFRAGLLRLIELGRERRSVVMCAEAVWWRCHRRIIADYLTASGERVFHIVGASVEPARLAEAARPVGHGVLTYPATA